MDQSILSKHFKHEYIGEGIQPTGEHCPFCAEKLITTHFMHKDDLLKHISFVHSEREHWGQVSAVEDVVSLDTYVYKTGSAQPPSIDEQCQYCAKSLITTHFNCKKDLRRHIAAVHSVEERHRVQRAQVAERRSEQTAQSDTEPFDLTQIPYAALVRLGAIFKEGDARYGRGNWRKGVADKAYQLERANHALKHLLSYIHRLETGEHIGQLKDSGLSQSVQEHFSVPHFMYEDDLAKVLWFCATQCELERLEQQHAK